MSVTAGEIRSLLLGRLGAVLDRYCPGWVRRRSGGGVETAYLRPKDKRDLGSFQLHLNGPKAGGWVHYSAGQSGDIIDLIGYVTTGNADMTAAEFWEAIVASLCQWGNGYAEKVTAAGGRVIALNFLRPELMMVERDRSGARVYRYSDPKGMRLFGEDAVFHVRGFGVGGDMGLSPVGYPDGPEGAERRFEAGDRPAGLSAEYEDLLIGKGHARRIRKAATASTGAAADRP